LPQSLVPALQEHQLAGCTLHRRALATAWGRLLLPYALARKAPNASRERAWPWVFPQRNRWRDRELGTQGHLFLLSLTTQLLERGQDIRTIQELLGHKEVSTTMTYTSVLNRGPLGVRSPADIL
jgi:integrase